MKFFTLLALFGVISAKQCDQKESSPLWKFLREKKAQGEQDSGFPTDSVEDQQEGAKQMEAIIRNKAQREMVKNFFTEMLATTKDNQDATFRCLTVQVYGQEAMDKLNFLDKGTTCPCLLQRLCFLVADEIDEERDNVIGAGPDKFQDSEDDSADSEDSDDSDEQSGDESDDDKKVGSQCGEVDENRRRIIALRAQKAGATEDPVEDDRLEKLRKLRKIKALRDIKQWRDKGMKEPTNEKGMGAEDDEDTDVIHDQTLMKAYRTWLRKENARLRAQAKWCEYSGNRKRVQDQDSEESGLGQDESDSDVDSDSDDGEASEDDQVGAPETNDRLERLRAIRERCAAQDEDSGSQDTDRLEKLEKLRAIRDAKERIERLRAIREAQENNQAGAPESRFERLEAMKERCAAQDEDDSGSQYTDRLEKMKAIRDAKERLERLKAIRQRCAAQDEDDSGSQDTDRLEKLKAFRDAQERLERLRAIRERRGAPDEGDSGSQDTDRFEKLQKLRAIRERCGAPDEGDSGSQDTEDDRLEKLKKLNKYNQDKDTDEDQSGTEDFDEDTNQVAPQLVCSCKWKKPSRRPSYDV